MIDFSNIEKKEMARRRFLHAALHAGVWTSLAGSGLFAPIVQAFDLLVKELPPGKSFHDLKGTVKVDGKHASSDTFVHADALVETGSNSYAVFVIGKDAHLLRENSRVQFSAAKGVIVRADGNAIESGLNLLTGKLLSVFGKRNAGETHTLQTTTATIGIRGTGVYVESEIDSSYVCTCYGVVDIVSSLDAKSNEQIVSRHHDAPRYILANAPDGQRIVRAPMKNHTDDELLLIEALVGRVPPVSSVNGYKTPRKDY